MNYQRMSTVGLRYLHIYGKENEEEFFSPLPSKKKKNLYLHGSFCCLISLAEYMIVPHVMFFKCGRTLNLPCYIKQGIKFIEF